MKKRLLPITLLCMLGLVACGPTTAPTEEPSTEPDVTTPAPVETVKEVKITNKTELTAEWHEKELDRMVKFTSAPETVAVSEDDFNITSSNLEAVTIMGKYLHAKGVGKSTITVTYKDTDIKDSVEVEVLEQQGEPEIKVSTVAGLLDGNDTTGQYQYAVKAKVSGFKDHKDPEKYGNLFYVDPEGDASKELMIYGSTASHDFIKDDKPTTAFAFEEGPRTYKFNNPKDFLTNKYTKDIKKGDILDTVTIRRDYNSTVEGMSIIRGINGTIIPNFVQTTDEVQAAAFQNKYAVQVTGKIVSLDGKANDGSEYGNVTIKTEGSEKDLIVYGLSANTSSLVVGDKGTLKFENPKDFLTNATTKALKVGDEITVIGVRCDYTNKEGVTKVEIQGYLAPAALYFADKQYSVEVGKEITLNPIKDYISGDVTYSIDKPEIATIDAATGKVTGVTEGFAEVTATLGTLTAKTKIHSYVKKAEPAAVEKNLAEVLADTTAKKTISYKTQVKVAAFADRKGVIDAATEYGGMNVTDLAGANQVYVDASSSTNYFKWSEEWGNYSAYNPKDFLANDLTKGIKIGDTLDVIALRNDFNTTKQLLIVVTAVNGKGAETTPDTPEVTVPEGAVAHYDLTGISAAYDSSLPGGGIHLNGDLTSLFTNAVTGENKVDIAKVEGVEVPNDSNDLVGLEKANNTQGPKVGGVKMNATKFAGAELKFTLAEGKKISKVVLNIASWPKKGNPEPFSLKVCDKDYAPAAANTLELVYEKADLTAFNIIANSGRFIITSITLY